MRNPVAKNSGKFNKAAVHVDRKKASDRGYEKHKGDVVGLDQEDVETPVRTCKKVVQGPKHLYIDLDSILFRAASAAGETTWYVIRDVETGEEEARYDNAKAAEEHFEFFGIDKECGQYVRETEYEIHPVEEAYKAFDREVKKWVKLSGCKTWTGYMGKSTGLQNFRHELATIKKYKGAREGVRLPHHLESVRRYARKNPNVKIPRGPIEVDDQVLAMAEKYGDKACLMSVDKDSRQCRGTWLMIPDEHKKPVWSDPDIVGKIRTNEKGKVVGLGYLFLLWQAGNGDSVDGIAGCKGWGSKKTFNILEKYSDKSVDELPQAVYEICKIYKDTYGNSYKYSHHTTGKKITASWKDIMIENIRLLWMLRHKNDKAEVITKHVESYWGVNGWN